MSNFLSKIGVKTAIEKKSKLDLSCDHLTTTDFFKYKTAYIKEMVPGESINVKMSTFTRLMPLAQPMLGNASIINRAFFVPCRTIQEGWNEFITQTVYGTTIPTQTTTIREQVICMWFQANSTVYTGTGKYDFQYKDNTGETKKYRFTTQARWAFDWFKSLGYGINLTNYNTEKKFSALPLLAFYKIWTDWYRNKQYQTNDLSNLILKGINKSLTQVELGSVISAMYNTQYNKDYFTSAWDNPAAPNDNVYSKVTIPDISAKVTTNSTTVEYKNAVTNDHLSYTDTPAGSTSSTMVVRNGTPVLGTVPNGNTGADRGMKTLSQYGIDALKKLTDYMKRHQLAGSLAMDRMLARFGTRPSDAALDRSSYLGSHKVHIQISDVMSTADTKSANQAMPQGSPLGDYAGKGIGYENGGFKYSTEEYGYFIIISVLAPRIGYVQGNHRMNQHISPLDWYTPEFDGLGVQGLRKDELLGTITDSAQVPADFGQGNQVFGYTSRYAEYKVPFDNLTGDFIVPTVNEEMDKWHLFRMIDISALSSVDAFRHDLAFCSGAQEPYDRIFANTSNQADHFITIFHFDVEDYAPMHAMFDDYEFEEEDHKRSVGIELNGTQLN